MRTRKALFSALAAGWMLAAALPAGAQIPTVSEKPAALVNGEPISLAEVKAVLDARPSPVPLTAAQKKELRMAALDLLIDDVLMRQFLRKHVPAPNPADVEKEIQDLKTVLAKQKKSLLDFLRECQQTETQLRADITSKLQWKAFLVARFPDATLKAYFDANKIFFDKVFVQASHILVKLGATAGLEEKQKARQRLEFLRQEILAGKITFEEAAKKYSDCPSKDKGGDIGPFPYKFVVVDPFARAAFAAKVGTLTDIVSTDFGLHLIKVTNRTDGEPATFEAVKETVREVYAQEQDFYQRIIAEQRKNSKIDILLP